jgi:sec-independent protein translocase protein TatA
VPFGIGPLELVIVLLIVLVIFGPKRLPGLGRSLGAGMREFKDSVTGKSSDEDGDDEGPRQLPAADPADAAPATAATDGERPAGERTVSPPRA